MMWFLRLFIASVLAAIGFPKVLATERLLPKFPGKPTDLVQQPNSSWTHNIKDDLTDWMKADGEWWMKFFCFLLYTQASLIVLLLVLA
jgi:hypothetical protein